MDKDCRLVEAEIRYLTAEEGGRRLGVKSGYRGQFHYPKDGSDWDATQEFPDKGDDIVVLGETVRVKLYFHPDRWVEIHEARIEPGLKFLIREGTRVVARGIVTKS